MGVFVSKQSVLIGLVCVQRGWGRSLGSTRLKVKCRHGSIELGWKGQRPAARDSGAWEINVTALRTERELCRSQTFYTHFMFRPLSLKKSISFSLLRALLIFQKVTISVSTSKADRHFF